MTQDEREMLMEMPAVLGLLAEEREACAKLADELEAEWQGGDVPAITGYGAASGARQVAKAIRARSNA